ncbi:MAG: ATP-dependent metallopeptidase HflB, partial [Lachnospiraceae bacterium]|nr:ATP-dependent metallopeptidase HflB [Lachnospiraceae bacterium]
EEVMKILKDAYKEAKDILSENREILDKIAAHLIEKETITGKEFMQIFRKEKGLPDPEEEKKEEEKVSETKDTESETSTASTAVCEDSNETTKEEADV